MRTHTSPSTARESERAREIIQQKQLNVQTSRFKWLTGHEVAININEIKRVEMTKKLRKKTVCGGEIAKEISHRVRERLWIFGRTFGLSCARERASEHKLFPPGTRDTLS